MNMRTATVLALAAPVVVAGSPLLLRHVDFFEIRQIEVRGVRYLALPDVLGVAAVGPNRNLFDDLDAIERRLERMAGVDEVRVRRLPPATLRITLRERTALALASGPAGMVALDDRARPLPFEPAAVGLDLPVVARADSVVTTALAVVGAFDPELYERVEYAFRTETGEIVLACDAHRIVFGTVPTGRLVEAVSDLHRTLEADSAAYRELDARFAGWIVVRREVT